MTTNKDSVEQVDREAAAKHVAAEYDDHALAELVRDGSVFNGMAQAFARHRIEATRQLEADKAEAFGLLKAAYEASSPYIVHNVGIGEVRDEIEDFLAKHRRPA